MAISGLGTVTGLSGTQYDFSNMTNAQAAEASDTLLAQGKISTNEAAEIKEYASLGGTDTIPFGSDAAEGNAYIAASLSSSTPHNYIDTMKESLAWAQANHADQAAATFQGLLNVMESYQATTGASSTDQSTTGAIISARA